MKNKKTAIIFGVSGQDGAYLSHFLLQKGYKVIGTTRNKSKKNLYRLKKLKIINKIILLKGEATDLKFCEKVLNSKINEIYYLSGDSSVVKSFNILLKKNGKIFGSTPFLYRIHGAPKDYCRYTKDFIKISLKETNYKNIKIKELGTGPFLASFSLLRGIFKFIPFFYQLFLALVILLDKILSFFMKTDPKNIYPVGYIFSAQKK